VRQEPAEAGKPIRVGASPVAVAVGEGGVWTADNASGTVTRIDPTTGRVRGGTTPAGEGPLAIAVGEGAVWVASGEGAVRRIDPATGRAGDPIPVEDPAGIAAGEGAVWVTSRGNGSVTVIDPRTESLSGEPIPVGAAPVDIATGEGGVWVANTADGTVSRIDPRSRRVDGDPIAVADEQVLALTVGEGAVWAAGTDTPLAERIEVKRIDPGTGEVDGAPIPVDGATPIRMTAGLGSVWVTDVGAFDGTQRSSVTRIDPLARAAGQLIEVGARAAGIAAGEGAVWVANSADATVTPIRP